MRTREEKNAARFERRMWVTVVLCALALVTVILAFFHPAFHFNKNGGNIMPDLIGTDITSASEALKRMGVNASISYAHSDDEKDTVIEQSVPAGEGVTHNQTVSIKVSLGPEAAPSAQEGWNTVPNFSGLTVENAEVTAQKLELKIVVGEYINDDNVRYGSICEQEPVAGTKVPPGTEVLVNLSAGPRIVRYTITASAGPGGSISPNGTVTVEAGKSTSFAIKADDGYVIDTMTVDGESVTPQVYYQFSDVNGNHTISVTFRESHGFFGLW
ncbi:MAG: PASTA domain-containing protein [Oscillospiraceae bacterium]|nr:PASTA domain-containing protein [Oscillospiraceae bacterium]